MKKLKLYIPILLMLSCCSLIFLSCEDETTSIEICNNGIDDDGDGNIDCADGDCASETNCLPVEICNNGIDDDGDGDIDCADSDCSGETICNPVEICDNGIDDDGDGLIDCLDSDCSAFIGCVDDCSNGIDDDGDGDIDCFDSDCSTFSEPIYTASWVGFYTIANGLISFPEEDNLVITSGASTTDNIVNITSEILRFSATATITSCNKLNLEDDIVIDYIPVGENNQDTVFNVLLGDNSIITINEDIQTIFINFQGVVITDGTTPVPLFPYPISGVEIKSDASGSARQ
ncbi:MAG: hypothetical protein KDD32_09780, partial [Bacteroidetes bacterium]|nr:hypothetical protein [Bacteroidota bacterium]